MSTTPSAPLGAPEPEEPTTSDPVEPLDPSDPDEVQPQPEDPPGALPEEGGRQ